MMSRSYLRLRTHQPGAGRVEREGVEQPSAEIVAERDRVIVLKVPGRGYWSGRGMPQGYAPAEFQVWLFEQPNHEKGTGGWANLLIAFPVRKAR